ncbi:MAG TPA: tripartite tricarboxylate transporter substrate binding protein [Bradyrhizobium sp.]
MITRRDFLTTALAAATTATQPLAAAATQAWPSTYLKLLVGGAAGSVPDTLARVVADALGKPLGQTIVVENRPGAGGIVAMQGVIGAPPDGYTIALTTIAQLVYNSYLFARLPYDPLNDVRPISTIAGSAAALVAHPSLPVSTLADLIALSRKEPGQLLVGIPSNGSPPHIAALLLMRETKLAATIVPFRSGPDALTAVIRGDVQLLVEGPTAIAAQVDSKTVKPIVVTGPHRMAALKDVPTIIEMGYPSAVVESWIGLVAPARTPDAIVERLGAEVRALVKDDAYVGKLAQISFTPKSATPQEFADLIAGEHRRWAPVLQASGLKFG